MELANFLSLWKESIGFLQWNTLKLLLLVTLNGVIQATKLMFKYFWLLIIFMFIPIIMGSFGFLSHTTSLNIGVIFFNFYLYFFILAIRPSVEKKDPRYFLNYFSGIIIYMFTVLPPIFFAQSLLLRVIWSSVSIPFSYAIFFFLDSNFSFKEILVSLKRGFILTWSFLPGIIFLMVIAFFISFIFSIFIGLFFTALSLLIGFITSKFSYFLTGITGVCAALVTAKIFIGIMSILYTKIKHSHFSLFFE